MERKLTLCTRRRLESNLRISGPRNDLNNNENVMIRSSHISTVAEIESCGFQRRSVLRRSGMAARYGDMVFGVVAAEAGGEDEIGRRKYRNSP